jgi:hypothetical protein
MRLSGLLILLLSLLFLVILGYIIVVLYTTHLYKSHYERSHKRREYDPVDERVYVYKNDPVWWGGYNVNWGPHYMNPYPTHYTYSYDLRRDPMIVNKHKYTHNYIGGVHSPLGQTHIAPSQTAPAPAPIPASATPIEQTATNEVAGFSGSGMDMYGSSS